MFKSFLDWVLQTFFNKHFYHQRFEPKTIKKFSYKNLFLKMTNLRKRGVKEKMENS